MLPPIGVPADFNLVFTRVVNHYVTVVGTQPRPQKVSESQESVVTDS